MIHVVQKCRGQAFDGHIETRGAAVCNLIGPVCGNCQRRREICDYQLRPEFVFTRSTSVSLQKAVRRDTLQHGPQWPVLPNELADEILSNFVKRTSSILTLVADWSRMWHHDLGIHPVVMQHEYVREAAMALSALHICRLGPSSPYCFYKAACVHSIRASAMFRAEVGEVTMRNWWQVLLFALMLMLFHLDSTFVAQDIGLPPHPNGPWETLQVLRQTALMSRYLSRRLWGSKAGAVMYQGQLDLKLPTDDLALSAIDNLIAYCDALEGASTGGLECKDAAIALRT
ncbi:hypothetical protein GQ53DRAFT_830823 [Thozetella sp. PMI_491]|nr:hypothetical protein GQ53DRAFT_830823 [Thozetella sp. PMI_491]